MCWRFLECVNARFWLVGASQVAVLALTGRGWQRFSSSRPTRDARVSFPLARVRRVRGLPGAPGAGNDDLRALHGAAVVWPLSPTELSRIRTRACASATHVMCRVPGTAGRCIVVNKWSSAASSADVPSRGIGPGPQLPVGSADIRASTALPRTGLERTRAEAEEGIPFVGGG